MQFLGRSGIIKDLFGVFGSLFETIVSGHFGRFVCGNYNKENKPNKYLIFFKLSIDFT